MSAWIFSIVGVIFTSVVFEIIVPNGKTNSFIKSILVIIFMYVVLSPVIGWINNDNIKDFSSLFEIKNETQIDK